MALENFGRNVRFEPGVLVTPADAGEVLACLDRYRGRTIRAVGRLHSWSDAPVCQDVVLDLHRLNTVAIDAGDRDGRSTHARIGAGCTIDAALDYLDAHGEYTLPTVGAIGKQTMAGAMATATHGSGRASLSHYVDAVTVATYDTESGQARVREYEGGEALRAARCALGCMGIVLAVRMRIEPDYLIEERTQWFDRIDQVLGQEHDDPLQQFYLIPWSWRWFAQLRRPLSRESGAVPTPGARLERVYRLIGVDILFNGAVRLLSGTLGWSRAIRWVYRRGFPLIARSDMRVTDRSRYLLMMHHDLYTHVEMEMFVREPLVGRAAAYVEWVLRRCGGESLLLPEMLSGDDFGDGRVAELDTLSGSYVHDSPITFRRVLRDDALISMTSGDDADAWYAISLITYQRDLRPFTAVTAFIAATMASAYGARPHWGKVCPLDTHELAALHPGLPRFRDQCASVDPGQVFVNDFARRALGL